MCRRHCYAVRTEQYRRHAAAKYAANLALAGRPDFARRVRAFLVAHAVRVVRVHTGGEFFSARSARRWRVVSHSPRVRFFTDTRARRVSAVRAAVDGIAALPNARVWFSCDRETGLPDAVPCPGPGRLADGRRGGRAAGRQRADGRRRRPGRRRAMTDEFSAPQN